MIVRKEDELTVGGILLRVLRALAGLRAVSASVDWKAPLVSGFR